MATSFDDLETAEGGTATTTRRTAKKSTKKATSESAPATSGDPKAARKVNLSKLDLDNIPVNEDGSLSAEGLPCLFSGKPTIKPKAKFLPGYDAKMKSLLLKIFRGEEGVSVADIPPQAVPFLKNKAGLVGFRLKNNKLTQIEAA